MTVLQFRQGPGEDLDDELDQEPEEGLGTLVEPDVVQTPYGKARVMRAPVIADPPSFVNANPSMPTSHERCGEGYIISYFDPSGRFFSTYHVGCGHEFPVEPARPIGFGRQYSSGKEYTKKAIGFKP